MEIEKSTKGSAEIGEKEEKKKKQHRRGGIRTLPFILGKPLTFLHHYYTSLQLLLIAKLTSEYSFPTESSYIHIIPLLIFFFFFLFFFGLEYLNQIVVRDQTKREMIMAFENKFYQ